MAVYIMASSVGKIQSPSVPQDHVYHYKWKEGMPSLNLFKRVLEISDC